MKIATSPLKRSPLRDKSAQGIPVASVEGSEGLETSRLADSSSTKSPSQHRVKRSSSSLREAKFTPLFSSFRVPRQKREGCETKVVKTGLWNLDEQRAFLHGIICFGWGQWKEIGTLVTTRTNLQIKSYGQKMATKQEQGEDIFAILKQPSVVAVGPKVVEGPVPKELSGEIGEILDAAQNLFSFKAPPTSENKKESHAYLHPQGKGPGP